MSVNDEVSTLSSTVPIVSKTDPGFVELSLRSDTVNEPPSEGVVAPRSISTSDTAKPVAPVENDCASGLFFAIESAPLLAAPRLSKRTSADACAASPNAAIPAIAMTRNGIGPPHGEATPPSNERAPSQEPTLVDRHAIAVPR